MSNLLYALKETIPDSTYKALYDALNEDLYYEHTPVFGPDTDDDDEQARQARQAELERKSNEIDRLFPNLPFSPNIDDLDRLDQEVYVSLFPPVIYQKKSVPRYLHNS